MVRTRVVACLDAGEALVAAITISGAVGAIGMTVGLFGFAGGTHFERRLWMWMKEDWRMGISGYLKSGSLSPGESRKCRSKIFCLPMMMKAQGREADPAADLASRRSPLACGERCDWMTHAKCPSRFAGFCLPTQRGGTPKQRDQHLDKSHPVNCSTRRQNRLTASSCIWISISTADYCTRHKPQVHFSTLRRQKSPRGCDGPLVSAADRWVRVN